MALKKGSKKTNALDQKKLSLPQKVKIKRIGFDFDKVFVSYPPVIPDKLIDFLYKGKVALIPQKQIERVYLKYRIPGKIEQQVRVLSHASLFRPPISKNIEALRKIKNSRNYDLFLISSRFGFLRNKTNNWLKRNKMTLDFKDVYFNFNNMQPHLFKEKIIKKKKIDLYVDDDLDLLVYISKKIPKIQLFWLDYSRKPDYKSLPRNIKIIKSVNDLVKYI